MFRCEVAHCFIFRSTFKDVDNQTVTVLILGKNIVFPVENLKKQTTFMLTGQ